ncbi:MAG: hypothetical protein DMG67_18985 [Acidobacteria bacterium]|nr:MAG: hypothetical protein DMG67_18985 [Acidobacteriota bacterium]
MPIGNFVLIENIDLIVSLMASIRTSFVQKNSGPISRLNFPKGYSAWVQYSNYPEDNNIDYYLSHSSWSKPLSIGVGTAHFMLPALR